MSTPSILPIEVHDLRALPAAALRRRCNPAELCFESTAELEPLEELPGQGRAIEALEFGIGMEAEGYNVFVLGPEGTGRHTLTLRLLEAAAVDEPTPSEWCYVQNFDDPRHPRLLELPPGRGLGLRRDMEKLTGELGPAVQAAVESESYRAARSSLDDDLRRRQKEAFAEIRAFAESEGVAMLRTAEGIGLLPMRDGEVLEPELFARLGTEEREACARRIRGVRDRLETHRREEARWEHETQERIRRLDHQTTDSAVQVLIEALTLRYADLPGVIGYLEAVRADVVERATEMLQPRSSHGEEEALAAALQRGLGGAPLSRRYRINLLTDRSDTHGAPVVYEDHPTLHNVFGRCEHVSQFGALITDYTLIRPGALHQANGGYLVVDAERLLQQPFVWFELKRALRSERLSIASPADLIGVVTAETLQPEPMPLDVKIVLVGTRRLYYLLAELDLEFPSLFKVAADVEEEMSREDGALATYSRLLATLTRRTRIRPLDRSAVARVVEFAARLTGDCGKLSLNLRRLDDVLREADRLAARAGRAAISREDVGAALEDRIRRVGRVEESIREGMVRGRIVIHTSGAETGQVNGLAVISLGEHAFGRPVRITARVRMGTGGVVDIDRKVHLGGPLHSKGVLILSAFLSARFLPERPLSLSASLTFEQSYSGVEGDSASLAEACALLSALAEVPAAQSLAVTGSVDQAGRVQAVGGINEKVEGFYDLCAARGLTGEQGVVIPAADVDRLMLREDVVAAAAEARFSIYPVETVDQAMALLTGIDAGRRDRWGEFPADTLNHRVERRLLTFSERALASVPAPVRPPE